MCFFRMRTVFQLLARFGDQLIVVVSDLEKLFFFSVEQFNETLFGGFHQSSSQGSAASACAFVGCTRGFFFVIFTTNVVESNKHSPFGPCS